MSIGALFNIGQSALNAQQATIATTGNNIANVDTPGYARQYVQLEDAFSLTYNPGALGMGVNAVQVLRRFDQFVEVSFLDKSSEAARWAEQENTLSSVESIFNESNRTGINDSLSAFFKAWEDLALRPDDDATRQNLVTLSQNLGLLMNDTMDDLDQIREQMDLNIEVDVERVNELVESIADLNKQITANTIDGVSNPNDLLNKRDLAVRELATYIDIKTEYTHDDEFVVRTTNGMPLVQGDVTSEFQFLGPRAENDLIPNSDYEGELIFDGSDSFEYTVEMLTGGNAGAVGDPNNPTYRVSLDGGQTWLKNPDGTEKVFSVTDDDGDGVVDPVQAHDVKISFSDTENFTAGDRFNITPKSGLYWVEPTRGPVNMTPQSYFDGTTNEQRLSGGSLTAHFAVRDDHIGRYEDEMNAVAEALIWEVNRIHSQGANPNFTHEYNGSEYVEFTDVPLGTPQSGAAFYDRLTEGNMKIHFYNESGDHMESMQLDMDPATDGVQDFDPAVHSLEDLRDAINSGFGGNLHAAIHDNKLSIESTDPTLDFAIGQDTTGVLATLGINTFFKGNDASNIAVNENIATNLGQINAGYVNGDNQILEADNTLANAVGDLLVKKVDISTPWRTSNSQSIVEGYSSLVSRVGADSRTAQTNAEYNEALANDLSNQQQAVSGVNLDEEMANLIKYQHAYTAAAKLITTADQMLETLLGLKQ